MKKSNINFIVIFQIVSLLFISNISTCQILSRQTVDSLICKSWIMKTYEINNEKQALDPFSEDRLIINKDMTLQFVFFDEIKNAKWDYNENNMTITIIDDNSKRSSFMKILELTSNSCIIENTDESGALIKMYMVPSK